MKSINQTAKPKMTSLKKIILYLVIIIIAVLTYTLTKPEPKPMDKNIKGFGSLYSGSTKSDGSEQPAKLRWFDSFKGIDNSGNK